MLFDMRLAAVDCSLPLASSRPGQPSWLAYLTFLPCRVALCLHENGEVALNSLRKRLAQPQGSTLLLVDPASHLALCKRAPKSMPKNTTRLITVFHHARPSAARPDASIPTISPREGLILDMTSD